MLVSILGWAHIRSTYEVGPSYEYLIIPTRRSLAQPCSRSPTALPSIVRPAALQPPRNLHLHTLPT